MNRVDAPWTADQVMSLNEYQHAGFRHPFTGETPPGGGERPVLIATLAGWVECEGGPVVQTWAHDFMADWSWKQRPILGTQYSLEDTQVIALQLQDAADDMNDEIAQWEKLLLVRGLGSGQILIPPFNKHARGPGKMVTNHQLRWTGKYLVYIDDKGSTRLLSSPRAARLRALKVMGVLYAALV